MDDNNTVTCTFGDCQERVALDALQIHLDAHVAEQLALEEALAQSRTAIKRKRDEDSEYSNKRFEYIDYSRTHIAVNQALWDQLPPLDNDLRVLNVVEWLCCMYPKLNNNSNKKQQQPSQFSRVYLCSNRVDDIKNAPSEKGWSCGYRNCQALLSFLEKQNELGERVVLRNMSVLGLQRLLEWAWSEGFDPQGAAQLKHRVVNTRKWIGTTEVYTMLTYLGVWCTILDFDRLSAGDTPTHQLLLDWIQSYFENNSNSSSSDNAFERLKGNNSVQKTNRPPLYLQHAGHSRTVIGIEIGKDGKACHLIVLDPGRRRPEENNNNNNNAATCLRSYRISPEVLAKKNQYQLLVLGEVVDDRGPQGGGKIRWNPEAGYLLTEWERNTKKQVVSIRL